MIKLYQTVRREGKHFVRGYIPTGRGRRDFLLIETSYEEVIAKLQKLQSCVNANHALRGASVPQD